MKKLFSVFALVFLAAVICLPLPVSGDEYESRVVDRVGYLTDSQISILEDRIESLSNKYDTGYVILIDDTGGSYPSTYANNFLESGGYKDINGGIIFFLCLEPGNECYQIEADGACTGKFTNKVIDGILDSITDDMKSGNYYDAILSNIELTDEALAGKYRVPLPTKSILIIIGAGVIAGLIVGIIHILSCISAMRVVAPVGAREYLVNGSFVLRRKDVSYLYSTVTRTARPKSDSSSGGGLSGGHSSGGRRL